MEPEGIEVDPRLEFAPTIPSRCYSDAGYLERERVRVFGRTWQLVGRCEQVAQPGSYFTADVAGEPIVVVRGQDGVLRALSKVCRHRGGPVAAGEGTCRAFRCGYHGWSYGLDGRILATPEFAGVQDFRIEEHPLPAFRVETWLARRPSKTSRRPSPPRIWNPSVLRIARPGPWAATGRSTSTTTSRGTTSRSSTRGSSRSSATRATCR